MSIFANMKCVHCGAKATHLIDLTFQGGDGNTPSCAEYAQRWFENFGWMYHKTPMLIASEQWRESMKGTGYIVTQDLNAIEYETIDDARDAAADLAFKTGMAFIWVAVEVVKPRRDVVGRATPIGAALEKAQLAAAKTKKLNDTYDREAKAEVDAIAPEPSDG